MYGRYNYGLIRYYFLIVLVMLSILFFPVIIFGEETATSTTTIIESPTASTTPVMVIATTTQPDDLYSLFAEVPILYSVARCESHLHQFDKDGTVLHGVVNYGDIGILQINVGYNGDTAKKLGYDIYTLKGNVEFGIWMYEHQGLQPWSASKYCWNK